MGVENALSVQVKITNTMTKQIFKFPKPRKMLFLPVAYLLQLLCQRCLNQWTSLRKRHHACFHVRNVSCAFHRREGIRSTLLGGVDNTFSLSIC